jgi:hypothetical protein
MKGYCGGNLNSNVPTTYTQSISFAGLNVHSLAACKAAARSNRGPLMTSALTTLPSIDSIVIRTRTLPLTPLACASSGYCGCTFFTAAPRITPSETSKNLALAGGVNDCSVLPGEGLAVRVLLSAAEIFSTVASSITGCDLEQAEFVTAKNSIAMKRIGVSFKFKTPFCPLLFPASASSIKPAASLPLLSSWAWAFRFLTSFTQRRA